MREREMGEREKGTGEEKGKGEKGRRGRGGMGERDITCCYPLYPAVTCCHPLPLVVTRYQLSSLVTTVVTRWHRCQPSSTDVIRRQPSNPSSCPSP